MLGAKASVAGKALIRNRIRELRFHAGEMTQAALAERIGMTRQTIVAIEQARYSPSLEAAFRIADVFGVEIGQVFQWDGRAPQDQVDGERPGPGNNQA